MSEPKTLDDIRRRTNDELIGMLAKLRMEKQYVLDVAHAAEEEITRIKAENERLTGALIQIRGFATVMAPNNWRDLRLHIERQCNVLRATPPDPEKRRVTE